MPMLCRAVSRKAPRGGGNLKLGCGASRYPTKGCGSSDDGLRSKVRTAKREGSRCGEREPSFLCAGANLEELYRECWRGEGDGTHGTNGTYAISSPIRRIGPISPMIRRRAPQVVDLRLGSHSRPLSARPICRTACFSRFSFSTSDMRQYPSPAGPKPLPGLTATFAFSKSCMAKSTEFN